MFRKAQRGLGIIAAIVILVILSSLAAFITMLSTTQNIGSALDVQGAKAYVAAVSGIEWGVYQTVKVASPPCAVAPGTATNLGSLDGMTVVVNCTITATGSTVEAGLGSLYLITATACNLPSGGICPGSTSSPNYVERRISAISER